MPYPQISPVQGGYPYAPYYGANYNSYPLQGRYGTSFGPYISPPNTPYEHLRAQLYEAEDGTKGMLEGAPIGGLAGAGTGAAIGFAIGNVPGAAVGALIGGTVGLIAGAAGGKKLKQFQGTLHDAEDDGRINGSPLLAEEMEKEREKERELASEGTVPGRFGLVF
jgi:hypothetical protein